MNRTVDDQKVKDLYFKNMTDEQIAQELNISRSGVFFSRKRQNLPSLHKFKAVETELTNLQLEVIIGTVLGDSTLEVPKDAKNARLTCAHCEAQKEYCEHKASLLKSLGAKFKFQMGNIDKRTNKRYNRYRLKTRASVELTKLYNVFYKNKRKILPIKFLYNNFTNISLAYMFMDDGCKAPNGYTIATNGFSTEEINDFRIMLFKKFNIETSLYKSNVLRIRAKSIKTFNNLIKDYIVPCMQYKLHTSPR